MLVMQHIRGAKMRWGNTQKLGMLCQKLCGIAHKKPKEAPVVPSKMSSVSCGAPSSLLAMDRLHFASSSMRPTLVCRRPDVSQITTSISSLVACACMHWHLKSNSPVVHCRSAIIFGGGFFKLHCSGLVYILPNDLK